MGECVKHIIVFPPSLNRLELGAFEDNRMIEKVIIPESVKVIEHRVFEGCANLKTVVAHDKIEEIKAYAFRGCDKLESIDFGMGECLAHTAKFPKNIKKIWEGAFITNHKSIFRNVMLSKYTDIYDQSKSIFLSRVRRGRSPQTAFGDNCTITYYDK